MIRLADFDLVQVFIVVIAVIAGFLNWLWKLIQQTRAEHERRAKPPEDPDERRLREEAWRRQVGQGAGKPYRPPPTATTPPGGDPFQTVRDIFRKHLAEEAARRAHREVPPPLPPPTQTREQAPPVLPHQQPARRSDSGTVRAEVYPAPARAAPPTAAAPETTPPVVIVTSPPVAPTPPVRFPTAPTPPLISTRRPAMPAISLSPVSAAPLPAMPDVPRQERPDIAALMSRMREPAALRQAVLLREILGPPKALQSLTEAPI